MKILTLFGCLFCFQLSAQQSVNLIILIDQDIPSGIQSPKIKVDFLDSSNKVFSVDYYPGRLTVSDSLFALFNESRIKGMKLLLYYTEFNKNKRKDYFYEIPVYPSMFDNYFNVLRIYNTSKKQYRKFKPLSGLEYTYGFQNPSGWRMPVNR